MHFFGIPLSLDPTPTGGRVGECPSCGTQQRMRRHAVRPRWAGLLVLFPSSDLLICPACQAVAREETVLYRLLSALFLLPFLLALVLAFGSGVYLLLGMARDGAYSGTFAALALLLLGVSGYAAIRVLRAVRRMLTPRKLLPMQGITTEL